MRRMLRFPTLAALFALALTAACSEAPRDSPEAAPEAAPPPLHSPLEIATALGVPNVHEPSPGLLTAGQVSQARAAMATP